MYNYFFCIDFLKILKKKTIQKIPGYEYNFYYIVHVYVSFSIKFVFPLNALAQNKTKHKTTSTTNQPTNILICTIINIKDINLFNFIFPFIVTNHIIIIFCFLPFFFLYILHSIFTYIYVQSCTIFEYILCVAFFICLLSEWNLYARQYIKNSFPFYVLWLWFI